TFCEITGLPNHPEEPIIEIPQLHTDSWNIPLTEFDYIRIIQRFRLTTGNPAKCRACNVKAFGTPQTC
ncbi:hypothetical protein, partial [Methanothrix sp.]|uniref:hypothetical protein n=1 Tax=Methanothrix sp. TaxID=90426 RepID=UPI003C7795BA